MRLAMGYPDAEAESRMLSNLALSHPVDAVEPVASGEDILAAQAAVKTVKVSEAVRGYIVSIADATRHSDKVKLGVSPRGSAGADAGLPGPRRDGRRDYVLPDDVKAVAVDVLAHRIICKASRSARLPLPPQEVLTVILNQLPVPKEPVAAAKD